MNKLLTFPDTSGMVLSIRAKAMLFHDPSSAELLLQVERIARSDATALIIGETGTGKELIARHIHTHSGRKGPFIAVNCGAFSESLIDAELFGHESGAYTGATQARAGWFETANGGTLFLDEIGDLSLNLQVKLLRILQERQVVRIGSRKPVVLDVRLVAATNVDLPKAVDAGNFREDLYYRLSVATIPLPPLCERSGDILPLAYHFIASYGEKMKLSNVRLSADAEAALLSYEWPGNIRELENVIHYALIVCRDGWIVGDDLKLIGATRRRTTVSPAVSAVVPPVVSFSVPEAEQLPHQSQSAQHQSAWEVASETGLPLQHDDLKTTDFVQTKLALLKEIIVDLIQSDEPAVFEVVEQTLIQTAFNFSGQNQVQAAKILGISRNILRTHLKNYGMIGEEISKAPDTHRARQNPTPSAVLQVASGY